MKQAVVGALRALGIALPAILLGVICQLRNTTPSWGGLSVAALLSALIGVWLLRRSSRRLQTVTSVLAAYREGDFSIRVRPITVDPALTEVIEELNSLGETLRERRLGEMEAWALLRKLVAEVDVIILACDHHGQVRLANGAAAKLLGHPVAKLIGSSTEQLDLDDLLRGPVPRTIEGHAALPGGPWELRRGSFRLSGEAHTLLVLSDVSHALRQRERDAWRRLVRVIGHEINNSLTPIQSISHSIAATLSERDDDPEWERDTRSGLEVIGRRSEALSRFMQAYSRLARLPEPRLREVSVARWVEQVASLEQRLEVVVVPGPMLTIRADGDQLEQLLINLVKNAAEASLDQGASTVTVRWSQRGSWLEVIVEDEGAGIAEGGNLFVPFFTTKPHGSGIGLALARQIAEAHGGTLTLENRSAERATTTGAVAKLRLPV